MFVDKFASGEIAVETFTDGEKAITAINASIPDLVFLDYRLPETTGEAVALRLNSAILKTLITGDLNVKVSSLYFEPYDGPSPQDEIQISPDYP